MEISQKSKTLFLLSALLVLLVGIVVLILIFKKVEVTVQSKMQIDPKGTASFIVPNEQIYKLKVNDLITYKVNGEFFSTKITKIIYDDTRKMFLATLDHSNKFLIPGTWMDIDIFKESKTVLSMLLSV